MFCRKVKVLHQLQKCNLKTFEATASGATKLSNTEKHRKKRLDPNFREMERFRDKLRKRKQRLNKAHREKEQAKDTERRRLRRLDSEKRASEQAKDTEKTLKRH